MASDFQLILSNKKHYGDKTAALSGIGQFEGDDADYTFPCTNVDPSKVAVLMFQSMGVTTLTNVIKINDKQVRDGLQPNPAKAAWNGNVLIVDQSHALKPTGNKLRIEARNSAGGRDGDIDDFLLDNMIIMYKTL
jgi:hypothetical protein